MFKLILMDSNVDIELKYPSWPISHGLLHKGFQHDYLFIFLMFQNTCLGNIR